MSVSFDAIGAGKLSSGGALLTDPTNTAITWSHTIAGNCVVAWINFFDSVAGTPTFTATCGGQSMTQLPMLATANGTITSFTSIVTGWILLNPPTGAQAISITPTAPASSTFSYHANSASYSGVGSNAAGVTAFGNSTSLSISGIVSGVGHMVANFFASGDGGGQGALSAYSGSSRVNDATTTAGGADFIIGDAAGAATVSVTATASAAHNYAIIAVDLLPPSGNPGAGAQTSISIPNPHVGPMALRNQKRMPYQPYRAASFADGANQTVTFTTSDDGFVDHKGARTSVAIPNPYVGPMAMRNRKHMPYVASQKQGYTDGANTNIIFTTSDNGVRGVRDGANSTWTFTTSDNGVRGVRDGANSTWTFATSDNGFVGRRDGANSTWAFTTSDDGFVDHPGAKTSIIIPNPNVGPMALRHLKHMPYFGSVHGSGVQALSDGANSTWVFTTSTDGHRSITDGANTTVVWVTSDDGFVDHPGAKTAVVIPNRFVGPQALRNSKHPPYVASQRQGYTDAANSAWVFSTSDNGHRGITDSANSSWIFSTSDNGFRGIKDGANTTIIWVTSDDGSSSGATVLGAKTGVLIPNPYVGPMGLRHLKRMPYRTYRSASFADAANSGWVFHTSDDGHRGITDGASSVWAFGHVVNGIRGVRDGANLLITFSESDQGHVGRRDGANISIVVGHSDDGHVGRRDGAPLTIHFATSDDGNLNRFLIDVLPGNIVIVGPNETRSVTITPEALTQIIRAAGYTVTVTDEQRTFAIPAGGAIQIV